MNEKINVATVIGILFFVSMINFIGLVFFNEKEQVLENELTRESVLSGSYALEIETIFGENFLYHDQLTDVATAINNFRGYDFHNNMEVVSSKGVNVAGKADENNLFETGWGNILILDDRAMEIHSYNIDATARYIEAVNKISESTDADVYSMLIPTNIEFEEESIYGDISYSQRKSIDEIYEGYGDKIKAIDVYDTLSEHSDEYIYLRTDHHWTSLGAYYAYVEYMKIIGDQPTHLNDYTIETFEGYLGSLYNLTLSDKLKENPDTIVAYQPLNDSEYRVYENGEWYEKNIIQKFYFDYPEQAYAVFLGGDYEKSVITTDANNGKNLLIIKDSYANTMVPFLTTHFEEIHIIDPRIFEDDLFDYIDDNEISDLLFVNYVLINRYTGYADFYLGFCDD